jgi:hypothetical protein
MQTLYKFVKNELVVARDIPGRPDLKVVTISVNDEIIDQFVTYQSNIDLVEKELGLKQYMPENWDWASYSKKKDPDYIDKTARALCDKVLKAYRCRYRPRSPIEDVIKEDRLFKDPYWTNEEWAQYTRATGLDNVKEIDLDSLVWAYDYDHSLRLLDRDIPVSKPMYVSYIGGITNEHFDLEHARKILEQFDWITRISHTKIPYYSATRYCTEALEFQVYFPQEIYDQYYEVTRGFKTGWAALIAHDPQAEDPLGLRPALIDQPT